MRHTEMLNDSFFRSAVHTQLHKQSNAAPGLAMHIINLCLTYDLNTTMHACRWIQDQHANHRSESWRNGMDEYLKYSKELQAKFPVAVDERAPSTGWTICQIFNA